MFQWHTVISFSWGISPMYSAHSSTEIVSEDWNETIKEAAVDTLQQMNIVQWHKNITYKYISKTVTLFWILRNISSKNNSFPSYCRLDGCYNCANLMFNPFKMIVDIHVTWLTSKHCSTTCYKTSFKTNTVLDNAFAFGK